MAVGQGGLPLREEFIAYIEQAANGQNFGRRSDGRFYPYSTPQGRRIAWRQPVWDKTLHAKGCTGAEAEQHLRADLARTQAELIAALAARRPSVNFTSLDQRQQETLLDLGYTQGVANLSPELWETVLSGDWTRLIRDHLYVRYAGHAPDHVRNKAFAQRWTTK